MEQNIKMSLEDYPRFVNDNDPELAIAKALFLSTRPNSHGFHLSEEVLRKYAPTILGKFLIGNLNIFENDVMSHEKKPDIFGYIPTTQQIEFKQADDGYLDAYVNIVVSKIYATEVYSLFLDDNFRNVSVEMRVMYTDEKSKDVSEFNIAGLTVLGKMVNPSVPRAHMEMVRFSADNAEVYYNSQMKCSSEQQTKVLRKLNAIYNNVNNEEKQVEENMAKLEEEKKDVVMEQPTEEAPKEEEKKLTEDAEKKDEEKEESKDEKASDDSKSEKKDNDKQEDEKASDDSDEDDKESEDKLAEKEAHCAELEAKCAELEEKLSILEKFKADVEEEKKMAVITQTLAQVKESMDVDTYAKFEEKAKDCSFDSINAWRNEVLANVATVLMSEKKDESHLRMGMENVKDTPTSLWDRM